MRNLEALMDLNDSPQEPSSLSPEPLRRTTAEPEPYPIDALSDIAAPAAKRLKDAIQAPAAMCGQSTLAAVALAVQGYRNVVIDGRRMPISENFITVGESGERKSAVDREVLKTQRAYQKKLSERYLQQNAEYENEAEIRERRRKEALQGDRTDDEFRKELSSLGTPMARPLFPITLIEEPTYEGLIKLLVLGQPSLGLFADEGGRMIGGHGMSQENQLKTAAGISELWDGKTISRIRSSDTPVLIDGRRFSMHLMAQPMVVQQLLCNPLLVDQGLFSRCLITWPGSTAGNRLYAPINLSEDPAMWSFHSRVEQILETQLPIVEGTQNELAPRDLPLAPDAYALWVKFYNNVERQLGPDGALAPIKGLANKAPEHVARLAGILCCFENLEASNISKETLAAAIELMNHYIGEALRLNDAYHVDPEVLLAEKVLLKFQSEDMITLPKIYQFGPYGVRDRKSAMRAVKILEQHRWFIRVPEGARIGGKHFKDVWRINRNESI